MSNRLKRGKVVAILNTSPSGRVVIEGDAVIVRVLDHGPIPRARVRFADGTVADRFIDLTAQADDPEEYVEQLNK